MKSLMMSGLILASFLGLISLATSKAIAQDRTQLEICAGMKPISQKAMCYRQVSGLQPVGPNLWDCRLLPGDSLQVRCFEKAISAQKMDQEILRQFSEICGELGNTSGAACIEYAFGNSYIPGQSISFSNSIYSSCKSLQKAEVRLNCFRGGIAAGLAGLTARDWDKKLAHYFQVDCGDLPSSESVSCFTKSIGGAENSSKALLRAYECAVSGASNENTLTCINLNLALAEEGY